MNNEEKVRCQAKIVAGMNVSLALCSLIFLKQMIRNIQLSPVHTTRDVTQRLAGCSLQWLLSSRAGLGKISDCSNFHPHRPAGPVTPAHPTQAAQGGRLTDSTNNGELAIVV